MLIPCGWVGTIFEQQAYQGNTPVFRSLHKRGCVIRFTGFDIRSVEEEVLDGNDVIIVNCPEKFAIKSIYSLRVKRSGRADVEKERQPKENLKVLKPHKTNYRLQATKFRCYCGHARVAELGGDRGSEEDLPG